MSDFLKALQLHSVHGDMAADFAGTLRKIKAMGYDGVEFAGLHGQEPDSVRKILAETGLIPVSLHISYDDIAEEDPMQFITLCKDLGCPQLVIAWMSLKYRPGGALFPDVMRRIRSFGELCREQGICPAYHNHAFEFVKIDGEYALDVLLREIPADCLDMQFDTCWVNEGGVSPADYLRKYAGRMNTVHLKDYVGIFDENKYMQETEEENPHAFFYRPVGYGVQDMPAIVQAARESGVTWFIVEQDVPSLGKTAMESAEMSVQYLQSL